ncbi:ABC transporter permease subunit [candidate division KSB3 bacterium]|uniref:ABC transporter permease subunit n=1 Tax=candidate division KSB3 bacterium TaxID=2044937 RepID=A0A9D5JYZ3_9BACT|nr:ABC transporter permease subunit [candidate division KSB3 bacterium]MBD3326809.1 ABC transporter permease subunit [candidate division KSB3 bacterium]
MHKKTSKMTRLDIVILAIVVAASAYVIYRINVGLNYTWNWGKIPQFLFRYDAERGEWVSNMLMYGLYNTLRLSFWGIILAIIFGTIMGICRSGKVLFFKLISGTYVESMRNLPPLVIIYIIYFFVGDQILPGMGLDSYIEARSETVQGVIAFFFAKPQYITSFLSALLTLAIFEGAYITEIVRAGIQSIEKGQWEASYALGMSWWQQMRHIILPQAYQRILPPLAGQFISLIKDSSIVSVISIQELTFQGTELMTSTLLTMEIWITVTILYLLLTLPCSLLVARVEKYMARSLR